MTTSEGRHILQHLAKMSWSEICSCAQQIAEKAAAVCKMLLPKENKLIPLTEKHLALWFVIMQTIHILAIVVLMNVSVRLEINYSSLVRHTAKAQP